MTPAFPPWNATVQISRILVDFLEVVPTGWATFTPAPASSLDRLDPKCS